MAAIVKTIGGLALASCKTTGGLAAASLKTVMGQDATASASTEYFGYLDTASLVSLDEWGGYTVRNHATNDPFTCPGTGTRRVVSLELWCKSLGGTPGVIRIAIYDTSLNLIGQGAATVTVGSTTEGWVGHVTTADLKPAGGSAGQAVNLTGGNSYVFAYSSSSGDVRIPFVLTAANTYYQATNNTGGFPDPLGGSETNHNEKFGGRVGVQ